MLCSGYLLADEAAVAVVGHFDAEAASGCAGRDYPALEVVDSGRSVGFGCVDGFEGRSADLIDG